MSVASSCTNRVTKQLYHRSIENISNADRKEKQTKDKFMYDTTEKLEMSSLVSVVMITAGVLFIRTNGCNVTLSEPAGSFASPGYPSSYPDNINCMWILQSPPGYEMEITFHVVDMEEPFSELGECLEFLQVFDGEVVLDQDSASFCGDGPPWPLHPVRFLSTENKLTVIMQTGANFNSKTGFNATYRRVPPRTEYVAAVSPDILSVLKFNRFSKRGQSPLLLPESFHPSAISFDPVNDYFYYTDTHNKFIGRVKEDGSGYNILIRNGIDDARGIAVAYLTRLLYWTDVTLDQVSVSTLDGLFKKTIASNGTGCGTPRGIVLSPDHQSVFWTCTTSIEMSNADGSGRRKLVFGQSNVTNLAIDPQGRKLYWVNAQRSTGFVYQINVDGTKMQALIGHSVFTNVLGFTMDEFAMFFSGDRKLYFVELHGTYSEISYVHSNPPPILEGLYYFTTEQDITAQHQCATNNGGCMELCLPDGESFTCTDVSPLLLGCPSDIVLSTCGPQTVSWQEPTARSRSNGQLSINLKFKLRTHSPGSTFFWGSTTVQYVFSDQFGMTVTCSFDVTLSEITSDIMISDCPDDIEVTTTEPQVVDWMEPIAESRENVTVESISHRPGSLFALGNTKVTYVFSTQCGQEAYCTFNIILKANENPMTSPTRTTTEQFNMNTFFEEYITYAIIGALLTCFLLVVFIIGCITCCCGCWKCNCRPKPRRPIVRHQYMDNMNKTVGDQEGTYMYADHSAPYTTPGGTGTYSTSI